MGRLQVCSDWRKQDVAFDWLGVYIWLSPVGPKLEARMMIPEAGSYGSSPGHLRLIVYKNCLASWIIIGDGCLTSFKVDLLSWLASLGWLLLIGWFPGLVPASHGYRLFLFMVWPMSICIFSFSVQNAGNEHGLHRG